MLLKAKGADLSIRDHKGNTALDYAEKFGFKEVAAILKQVE